ncbi:hypothetical protein PybrP1_003899 [[Pythium] brassicae (nom. inval.)]|nr:hypothetical protein PybrP1_003899 [[Pythium] brassicae (nom. inval.)]
MKIDAVAGTTLALLVAAAVAADLSAGESACLAACQADVMTHQVDECTKWRDRLPRPDLFSLCQDGYDLGVSAGCAGYCASEVNEGKLASLRLDACTFLRGTPPMDRMRACQSGFTSAVKRAKETSGAARRAAEVAEAAAHRAAEKEEERIPAAADTTAGRESEPKKISVKKAPEARNILELAREEAQAAFFDQRASDL